MLTYIWVPKLRKIHFYVVKYHSPVTLQLHFTESLKRDNIQEGSRRTYNFVNSLVGSTDVHSAQVNPWETVHFALSTSVPKSRISLGIYVHTTGTRSRLPYFKPKNNYMVKSIWKYKQSIMF